MKKEFSVQYIDRFGSARKVWHEGKTAKYTLDEAKAMATEMRERTGRTTKVCKGWTVIEVYEA